MELIDIVAVKNTGRWAIPFVQFLETFWNYDESPYIRDRLAHGYRFSRSYARECQRRLSNTLKPFFGDKKLNCVTVDDLKTLSNQLAARGLATSTVNLIMLCVSTPLKWAFIEKIIPSNPVIGLTRFSITNKERGVLTGEEAAAVFSVDWKDKRAFVASLVSATTGARMGECLALRQSDIGTDTLNIAHSYSPLDGIKCPKNGHKRIVPLLPEVKAALLDLLKDNPHKSDDPYIFYDNYPFTYIEGYLPDIQYRWLYYDHQYVGKLAALNGQFKPVSLPFSFVFQRILSYKYQTISFIYNSLAAGFRKHRNCLFDRDTLPIKIANLTENYGVFKQQSKIYLQTSYIYNQYHQGSHRVLTYLFFQSINLYL